jgi:hypothetical protein
VRSGSCSTLQMGATVHLRRVLPAARPPPGCTVYSSFHASLAELRACLPLPACSTSAPSPMPPPPFKHYAWVLQAGTKDHPKRAYYLYLPIAEVAQIVNLQCRLGQCRFLRERTCYSEPNAEGLVAFRWDFACKFAKGRKRREATKSFTPPHQLLLVRVRTHHITISWPYACDREHTGACTLALGASSFRHRQSTDTSHPAVASCSARHMPPYLRPARWDPFPPHVKCLDQGVHPNVA